MIQSAVYFVTENIAIRSGVIDSRYRIRDGRFVLDNKDLARIRFTTEEYINGLEGVEMVTEERAKEEIYLNNNQMGRVVGTSVQPSNEVVEAEAEQENENQEQEVVEEQQQAAEPQEEATSESEENVPQEETVEENEEASEEG